MEGNREVVEGQAKVVIRWQKAKERQGRTSTASGLRNPPCSRVARKDTALKHCHKTRCDYTFPCPSTAFP